MEEQVVLLVMHILKGQEGCCRVLSHLPPADKLRLLRAVHDAAHVMGCVLGLCFLIFSSGMSLFSSVMLKEVCVFVCRCVRM